MPEELVVDLVTEDAANNEYVLYLVEEGPWEPGALQDRLKKIQDRLYNAFDAAVDGHLAAKFPDSKGRNVRIQVDIHGETPPDIESLVARFDNHVKSDADYQREIQRNEFIAALRVVTRSQMGRV